MISRNNFIAIARHDDSKCSRVIGEAQTDLDEDEELYAAFLTESDPQKDYSINPLSFTDNQPFQPVPLILSPEARAQLEKFEESGQKARKYYSDALARMRGQAPVAPSTSSFSVPPRT